MPDSGEYIMNQAAGDRELARLRANESWMDEHTKAQLDATGLRPGWRCLEVAAGAGSIARWLADRVGPAGTVCAADINTRFLTDFPANVTVVEHDITGGPPERGAYDLVHSRSLLEHLPDPAGAIDQMCAAVRPGGWLVIESGDLGLLQFSGNDHSDTATSAMHTLLQWGRDAGFLDCYFGRRLPGMFHALDLADVEHSTLTATGANGDAAFLTLSLGWTPGGEHVSALGMEDDAIRSLDAAFNDPASHLVLMTMFGSRGRRLD
jgi:SAM-dependent methyltransferase